MTETPKITEVELVAIQEQAYKIARSEYNEAYARLTQDKNLFNQQQENWRKIYSQVKTAMTNSDSSGSFVEATEEMYLDEIARLATIGRQFETLQKASESNPIVNNDWKKLMMSLRMVGLDQVSDS